MGLRGPIRLRTRSLTPEAKFTHDVAEVHHTRSIGRTGTAGVCTGFSNTEGGNAAHACLEHPGVASEHFAMREDSRKQRPGWLVTRVTMPRGRPASLMPMVPHIHTIKQPFGA